MDRLARLMALKSRSKAVDPKTGELLKLYHGTATPFEEFQPLEKQNKHKRWGRGVYLTEDPDVANWYASWQADSKIPDSTPSTMLEILFPQGLSGEMIRPQVADVQNPLDLDKTSPAQLVRALKRVDRLTAQDALRFIHQSKDNKKDLPWLMHQMHTSQRFAPPTGMGYEELYEFLSRSGYDSMVGSTPISWPSIPNSYDLAHKMAREWLVFDPKKVLNPYTGLPLILAALAGSGDRDAN